MVKIKDFHSDTNFELFQSVFNCYKTCIRNLTFVIAREVGPREHKIQHA